MPKIVHPECLPECTHGPARPNGFLVQRHGTREEHEAEILAKAAGRRVDYLGRLGEDYYPTWRVNGRPWKPTPGASRGEEKAKREVKAEYRPAVWEGNGPPGPVDFSRPAEEEPQPYPAPALTSDMPCEIAPSRPAQGVLSLAGSLGWAGVITHAEGHVPHASWGTPGKEPKKSEAVRLARGTQRAVAVRVGGSWASLWTWSDTEFFRRHGTLEAFKEALR